MRVKNGGEGELLYFQQVKKRVIVFQFSFVGNSFHFLRGNHYENSEKNVFHAYSQYKCTPLAIRQGKREQHRGHMVSHPINCTCDQKKTPKNIYLFQNYLFLRGLENGISTSLMTLKHFRVKSFQKEAC